jgi:hypothetical protein
MTHICPACGKRWECDCTESVKDMHRDQCGAHYVEIACSEKCAYQLGALVTFLLRYIH